MFIILEAKSSDSGRKNYWLANFLKSRQKIFWLALYLSANVNNNVIVAPHPWGPGPLSAPRVLPGLDPSALSGGLRLEVPLGLRCNNAPYENIEWIHVLIGGDKMPICYAWRVMPGHKKPGIKQFSLCSDHFWLLFHNFRILNHKMTWKRKSSIDSFLRYGNPDSQNLATLKNKIQILGFLSFLSNNMRSDFIFRVAKCL